MLSNGMIVPNVDPFYRKNKAATHKPTYLGPAMRKSL